MWRSGYAQQHVLNTRRRWQTREDSQDNYLQDKGIQDTHKKKAILAEFIWPTNTHVDGLSYDVSYVVVY